MFFENTSAYSSVTSPSSVSLRLVGVHSTPVSGSTILTGTSLRIEYCQDCEGFWLSPHTDIGVKKFTMQIYLSNEPGSRDWGTDLLDEQKALVRRAPAPSMPE